MEKPPQLKTDTEKSDVELKVTGGEQREQSEQFKPSEESEQSDQSQQSQAGEEHGEVIVPSTEKSIRDGNEKISAQASKRAKEQEFLAAYKSKQIRTRIKFIACAGIVVACSLASVSFVFNNIKASTALARFQIAPLFACLGERDTAYFAMTDFSDAKTKAIPGLIERRTKILDNAIYEMEKNGHPAIFTRLGTEQMLIKFGDRASGLKYGEALITKYPQLPSNYFWRARIDFDNFDFANAIAEYKQAAELLKGSGKSQAGSWDSELSRALWACIDAGQIEDAKKFFSMFKNDASNLYDRQGLESQILITSCENIGAPALRQTKFWNEKLETAYKERVEKAIAVARKMEYPEVKFDDRPEFYRYELLDQAMPMTNDAARIKKWAVNSYLTWDELFNARMALKLNKPQETLAIVEHYTREYDLGEAKFLKASALQKLHRPQEAIRLVDELLQGNNRKEYIWKIHYLPLLTVKANALYDSAQYKESLAFCDKILTQNPNSVEPLLIKLRCYEALNDASAAAHTSKKILEELSVWLNTIEPDPK